MGKLSCDVCGDRFDSDVSLNQHTAAKHKDEPQKRQSAKLKKYGFYALTILILFGIVFAGYKLYTAPHAIHTTNYGSTSAPTIDGVECNQMEQAVFHIHTHLNVYINGTKITVPERIGVTNSCLYWLHTHDTTGVIHIEAPKLRTFTLGNFINIWQPDLPTDSKVTVFVDEISYTGDYRDINLENHRDITIEFGQVVTPRKFAWDYLVYP